MRKSKRVFRFLAAYLCVLIPIFCVSLLVNYQTMKEIRIQQESSLKQQLVVMTRELNALRRQYQDQSVLLGTKLELLPYRMKRSVSEMADGILILKEAALFDGNVSSIVLYYEGEEIFTPTGRSWFGPYFTRNFYLNSQEVNRVREIIQMPESRIEAFPGQPGFFLIHEPILNSLTGEMAMSVNFCIPIQNLTKILDRPTVLSPIYMNMQLENGQVLHFYGDRQDGLTLMSQQEYTPLDLSAYASTASTAKGFGAEIEVLYQLDELYAEEQRRQIVAAVLLGLAALASMVAAMVLSSHRETSLRGVEKLLAGDAGNPKAGSEYAQLIGSWRQAVTKNDAQMRKIRVDLRRQTATLIFRGLISDREQIHRLLSQCDFSYSGGSYFLGGVLLEGSALEEFSRFLDADLSCQVQVGTQRAIVFLVELTEPKRTSQRVELAGRLIPFLEDLGARNIRIGLSQLYGDIGQVNLAFLEVMDLLFFMSQDSYPANRIECWENMIHQDALNIRLVPEQFQEWVQALQVRDNQEAVRLLGVLNQQILQNYRAPQLRRYERYSLLQVLIQQADQVPEPERGKLLSSLFQIDLDSDREFAPKLRRLIEQLCGAHNHSGDFGSILTYLAEHFTENDLTLEKLAENSGYAKNYISALIKSKTGMSYIDYLTRLRMQRACELLCQTSLPVAEIVRQVGYIDVSSFRRKFRTLYGISVSEYRRQGNGHAGEK